MSAARIHPSVGQRLLRGTGRGLKIFSKILLGVLALVVTLVVALLITLETEWGQAKLRAQITSQLATVFRGGASIGHIDGFLLDRAIVHDVVIRDAEGRAAITAEELIIDYSLPPLLHQNVYLREIRLRKPHIQGYYDASGELNLSKLMVEKPDEGPSAWAVEIGELVIENGHFQLRQENGEVLHVTGIQGEAGLITRGEELDVDLRGLEATWENQGLRGSLSGRIFQDNDVLELEQVEARFGQSSAEIPLLRLADRAGGEAELTAQTGAARFSVHLSAADAAQLAPTLGLRTDVRVQGEASRKSADQPWAIALDVGAGPSQVLVQGQVHPAEPRLVLELNGRAIDPSAIVEGMPQTALDARVTADLTGDTLTTLSGSAVAELSGTMDLDMAVGEPEQGGPSAVPRRYRIDSSRVELRADQGRIAASARLNAAAEQAGAWASFQTSLDAKLAVAEKPAPQKAGDEPGLAITIESARLEARLGNLGKAIPGPSSGSAQLVVTAQGPLDRLDVRGTVTGKAVRVADLRVRKVRAQIGVTDLPRAPTGSMSLVAEDVRYGADYLGPVAVTADMRDRGEHMNLDFSVGTVKTHYSAAGRIRASRRADGMHVSLPRLDARTRTLRWKGSVGSVLVTDQGHVRVEDLRVRSDAADLHLDARLDSGRRQTGQAELTIADVDIGKLAKALDPTAPPMTGSARVEAKVSWPRWQVDVNGRVERFWVAKRMEPINGSFSLTVADRLAQARAKIDSDSLGNLQLVAVAKTPADLANGPAWQRFSVKDIQSVRGSVDRASVRALAELAGQGAQVQDGRLSAALLIGAGLESGDVEIRLDGLRLQDVPEPLNARMAVDLIDNKVHLSSFIDGRRYGAAELRVQLTPPKRPFLAASWQAAGIKVLDSAHVTARDVDLHRLRRFMVDPPDIYGYLDIDMTARERGENVRLRTSFRGINVEGMNANLGGHVKVDLRPDDTIMEFRSRLSEDSVLDLDARVSVGTRDLITHGASALDRARVDAKARIPNLSLATVKRALNSPHDLRGRIDAVITAQGSLREPKVEAKVQTSGAVIAGLTFDELWANGRYDKGAWSGRLRASQIKGGYIQASASGHADGKTPLRASLEAKRFRLGFLSPILAEMDGAVNHVDGELSAEFERGGTMAKPTYRGWLRVKDGRVHFASGMESLHDAQGHVVVDRGKLTVRLESDAGRRGELSFKARADLDGLTPRELQGTLRTRALPVLAGTTPVAVDSRVELRGRRKGRLWQVGVRVHDGLVRLPLELGSTQLHDTGPLPDVVYLDEGGAAQAKKDESASTLALRMQIETPGGVRIRGDEIEAVADAKLDMTLIRGNVAMTGVVRTVRGRLTALDRRYDILRARAVFEGNIPPEPRIDVRLAHQADEATVYIDVTGTVRQPRLELSASPGRYDRAQILAFVLGGNLDNTGDNRNSPSLEQRTTGALGGFLSSRMERLVKETFPVDYLRVEMGEGGENVSFVTVGKWIGENVFVAYRRRFDDEPHQNVNEAQVEYQVSESWVVEGSVGDEGIGSADVLWTEQF